MSVHVKLVIGSDYALQYSITHHSTSPRNIVMERDHTMFYVRLGYDVLHYLGIGCDVV